MASQGPNSPSTVVDDAGIGTLAWTSPGNATASDDTRTTVGIANSALISHYLKATGFGFTIPSVATVVGLVVEWEKGSSTGNRAKDAAVRIVKGDVIGATDRSDAARWAAADTYITHGSATDLWGETWSPSEINASDFGAALAATNDTLNTVTARIDHVRITVYFTEPGFPFPRTASRRMVVLRELDPWPGRVA